MITRVKVWIADKNHRFAGECRIYVDFSDRKQSGCYYKTGNAFDAKGTRENMSVDELAEAKALALVTREDGKKVWQNYTAEPVTVSYRNSEAARRDREARDEEYARQTRIVRGLVDPIESGLV